MPEYGPEFEKKIFHGCSVMEEGKKNKDFTMALKIFEDAWSELPEPKYYYNESYLVALWMVEIGMELKDNRMMLEWIPHLLAADKERADIGDREEAVGEAYYEMGDLDKAFEYFSIGVQKSRGGRCFAGRDKKYKKFYLDRK